MVRTTLFLPSKTAWHPCRKVNDCQNGVQSKSGLSAVLNEWVKSVDLFNEGLCSGALRVRWGGEKNNSLLHSAVRW